MSLSDKPVQQITQADLQSLVDNRVAERKILEYKLALPGRTDTDKREMLADASSFANASGGDLLYGVAEKSAVPVGLPGIAASDADAGILRLESSIRDGVQPRIGGVTSHPVSVATDRVVLVVRIPRSWAAPHMVTFGGLDRFYTRNSRGKYQMDVGELRLAFTAAQTAVERARNFRLERVGRIITGETPISLDDRARVVLHIVPLSPSATPNSFDLASIHKLPQVPSPMHTRHNDYRYNLDGLLFYAEGASTPTAHSYLQFFRDGSVEAVSTSLLNFSVADSYFIQSVPVEDQLISSLTQYLHTLRILEFVPPFAVMVSLLGIQGFRIMPSQIRTDLTYPYSDPIPQRELLLPDVVMENSDLQASQILKPVFDVLWNAAGLERCLNYTADGSRILERR